jgi:hypothetical protein
MKLKSLSVACLLLVATVSICVYGQSGRRQPKATVAPPVPTPTPDPTPAPTPTKEPEFGFIVGVDRNSTYASFPFSYYNAVLQGCADRLRTGSSARVTISEKDLNRGDAIKQAKGEEKTYVVWLKLSDGSLSTMSNNTSGDELQLEYVVFSPLTAKIATSGTSYQNGNRKGPLIVGPTGRGPSSAIYREQLLKHAGEDAGERILRALHLSSPRTN